MKLYILKVDISEYDSIDGVEEIPVFYTTNLMELEEVEKRLRTDEKLCEELSLSFEGNTVDFFGNEIATRIVRREVELGTFDWNLGG